MRVPNRSRTIKRFSFEVAHFEITTTITDHRPDNAEVQTIRKMNLQPLKADEYLANGFDVTLRYVRIFDAFAELKAGNQIEHNGLRYKIVSPSPYNDYGYWEAYGEEIK